MVRIKNFVLGTGLTAKKISFWGHISKSITTTLQKYYNFVTIEGKYCERDASVVELKRTCG